MLDNTPQPLLYQQPHLACAIFIILYTQMLANTILNTHIYFYFYILGILIFLYPLCIFFPQHPWRVQVPGPGIQPIPQQ